VQAVTLTINQQEVSGPPGQTILELARESGIAIPTLCHHALLSPLGGCRICIVENEANGALLASCVTAIAPGMIINTRSPRVQEHRRMILKMMLASHPDSCLVCDKGNRCELRQLAAELGIGLIELDRIPQAAVTEELNPFLVRDGSKCILCARCIRACQELVVVGALDYFGRGFKTKAATLFQAPLENSACTFCGTCVALCPTGALMEKEPLYRGSVGSAVESICPYCSCGCSISLEVKDNRVVRVMPGKDPGAPESLCVKGSYGCDFIHSPERLTVPLIREGEGFREASWKEALAVAAAALQGIRKDQGAESLAFFGSANCTNEENYLFQRFTRTVLRTNNLDNGSSLYYAAARRGFHEVVGFPTVTYPLGDLALADLIIVIGADPTASAPLVDYGIRRAVTAGGAKLIVIDPRETGLAFFAHRRLQPAVGTDLALLKAMAAVIIEENLTDREFIARKTENYRALLRSLEGFSLESAAAATGISAAQIVDAARLYATADKGAIVFGTGIMQQARGVEAVKALLNLALLTGHIWREGGGIWALLRECNAQGAGDMGMLPNFLPGRQDLQDPPARERFEARWRCTLPTAPGKGAAEMITAAEKGEIRGMIVAGENPAAAFPRSSRVKEALGGLDFLLVLDIFMTDTAGLADVILPAASFAEKEGAFTGLDGRVRQIRRAVDPPGECRPDWQIILELAAAMDHPLPFSSPGQIRKEIEDLIPFYRDEGSEVNLEGDAFWESGPDRKPPLKRFPAFTAIGDLLPPPAPNPDYPFILLAESTLFHAGSGSRSARSPRLSRFTPHYCFVKMNRADARRLALQSGDVVAIISENGRLTAVVSCDGALPEGVLSLPRSRIDHPLAALFSSPVEEDALSSALKKCYVRIERSGNDGSGAS